MKRAPSFVVVFVTAPNRRVGRLLAQAILRGRQAACVNVVPGIESFYWWQGKLERSGEVLLMIKTRRSRLATLERLVRELHPYDTPEFIVLPIVAGNARYLEWIRASLGRPG